MRGSLREPSAVRVHRRLPVLRLLTVAAASFLKSAARPRIVAQANARMGVARVATRLACAMANSAAPAAAQVLAIDSVDAVNREPAAVGGAWLAANGASTIRSAAPVSAWRGRATMPLAIRATRRSSSIKDLLAWATSFSVSQATVFSSRTASMGRAGSRHMAGLATCSHPSGRGAGRLAMVRTSSHLGTPMESSACCASRSTGAGVPPWRADLEPTPSQPTGRFSITARCTGSRMHRFSLRLAWGDWSRMVRQCR